MTAHFEGWHRPIGEIEALHVLDFIAELQAKLPETASRVLQRLEVIFDDAEFRKLSHGNPARAIRRKLREAKGRRERGSFNALSFKDAPAFVRELRTREGIAARALEFALQTAAPHGRSDRATWTEFDLEAGTWTVPAARMKGGEKHVVYLPQPGALDAAAGPEDMAKPTWHLHPLKGDLAGHWAVRVNQNWRLTFRFEGEDAVLVDYQDYH